MFEALISHLLSSEGGKDLIKLDVRSQFESYDKSEGANARKLNAAFLLALCGKSHPLFEKSVGLLEERKNDPRWAVVASFYLEGLGLIKSEIAKTCDDSGRFRETLTKVSALTEDSALPADERTEAFREVFFPEGLAICQRWEEKISELREKRKIKVTRLNDTPIQNPASEILFTSNILITTPLDPDNIDGLTLPSDLKEKLRQIVAEEQLYWYDHPIPIGVAAENNEALYGLRGLDEAVSFEKQRGVIRKNEKLTCVLSVSVTHKGLQDIAKRYLEEEFKRSGSLQHLDVYLFTEADTSRLIDEVLAPAIERYIRPVNSETLHEIIGVDGEYGRHYTFLKAISAFWHVLIDAKMRATFKIDLDQVFPQEYLLAQSRETAMEHLKSPLWGAQGVDSKGRQVELGMIAGALVNRKDISKSLFYPDVCLPAASIKADQLVFFSHLPQALSTEAEMMTRYEADGINGKDTCIQRIHVTGGTSGILVEGLRRHRPFTPVFIGRAEDQAFLLSVLFEPSDANLRYVHKDGLIMRHDKEAFAGEAIKAARIGKMIGDYMRILWFSYYSRALPWPTEDTKDLIDPFTGCFVSRIPFTIVYLRFALKVASLLGEDPEEGLRFLDMGSKRLLQTIRYLNAGPNPLEEEYQKEKSVWNLYYDALTCLEKGLGDSDSFALEIQAKARAIVENCRMSLD